jgi:rhamnosyltransferase
MQENTKASIIIRAYNEEKHIEKLLQGIRNQKVSFRYEVILVDSGSNDNTVDIAQGYSVEIVHITPAEFSFGCSLNKGIEKANGEYCIFISAHCYPVKEYWLENLILPFADESIALVYGKQRGNKITKYSEQQIFKKWFPESGSGKQESPFCNNANAAIRKSLWEKYRYNETLTGLEDIDWAKNIISQGYSIFYASNAEVIHVHNETFLQLYRRYEREAIAMRSIYPQETFTFFDFIKLFTLNTLSDYIHAIQDNVLIKNLLGIPAMRLFQFWGTYRGYNFRKPILSDLRQRFYYPRRTNIFYSRKRAQKND